MSDYTPVLVLQNVKEACEVCEEQVLVKKMEAHLVYCRRVPPPEEPEPQPDSTQRRTGRNAARK